MVVDRGGPGSVIFRGKRESGDETEEKEHDGGHLAGGVWGGAEVQDALGRGEIVITTAKVSIETALGIFSQ